MIQDNKKAAAQKRENPDPQESSTPIPKTVIVLIGLTLLWAVGYIVFMARPNDAPALGDSRTMADLKPQPASAGGAADGAQIFAAQCVACHQATGAGLPGVFPPLAGSEWVLAKETLPVNILLHGISGKLTVKGASYNGQMPAFGAKLNDNEIAAVLSYVRTSFGNSAGKIDAAAVKAARDASKDRQSPWNGDDDLNKLK
jgi:mono/diheme cytochrome c family protein